MREIIITAIESFIELVIQGILIVFLIPLFLVCLPFYLVGKLTEKCGIENLVGFGDDDFIG